MSTLVCLVAAIFFGIFLKDFSKSIKFFGDWYVQSLKVIIGPMIFCCMSLFVLEYNKKNKFLFGKTILLFILMFVTTFLISSALVLLIKPGIYFQSGEPVSPGSQASFDIGTILLNLLPKSFEDLFFGKCIFFVIVCALLIALIIRFTKIKDGYTKVIKVGKKYIDIILKVLLLLIPLAVLSLVSNIIATYDTKAFNMGLIYILCAYGLSVIAILLVMILPVWIFAHINPLKYIKKVAKVWLMTITTCSSAATLPYTIKCCNEDFNIDERITNVVVPLGCTIHMCGGAVSFSLLGLFVAQMNGIAITLPMFLLMLLSATLINMAAPGIPGGGVVIGFTYLSIFNFPLESFYGVYAGIYKFLDMSYTTLNVTGDISANILIDNFEKRDEKRKEKKLLEANKSSINNEDSDNQNN